MPGYYQFRHPRVAKRSVFPESVHHVRLSKDSRVTKIVFYLLFVIAVDVSSLLAYSLLQYCCTSYFHWWWKFYREHNCEYVDLLRGKYVYTGQS